MVAWFVSDIHIKDINERNSIILLRFLNSITSGDRPCTHLFLLGDIFDLWVGDSDHFQKKYQTFVDLILKIKNAGIQVLYFEGNHDLHLQSFWSQKFGIQVVEDIHFENLGPWKVRMEHGDLINHQDLAYLRLRKFLRLPQMKTVFLNSPGVFFDFLGQSFSKISRKKSSEMRKTKEDVFRTMIRSHAERIYNEESFDYIITGHMHIRDEYLFKVNGKDVRSINLGSWFEEPAALCLTDKGHSWVMLD